MECWLVRRFEVAGVEAEERRRWVLRRSVSLGAVIAAMPLVTRLS